MERARPDVLVLDSINGLADAIGRQPLDVLAEVTNIARDAGGAAFVTTHLNREGDVAGPERMKNLVDCLLWIDGVPSEPRRVLRTTKNRFGDASVRAVLRMTATGLVDDDGAVAPRRALGAGAALGLVRVDGKPLLVEVEAMIAPEASNPRRVVAHGCSGGRVAMVVAIVERAGVVISGDVTVRLAGGITCSDVALDAGIAGAIVSAARGPPLAAGIVLAGEISLDGVVRGSGGDVEGDARGLGLRLVGRAGERLIDALARSHLRSVS